MTEQLPPDDRPQNPDAFVLLDLNQLRAIGHIEDTLGATVVEHPDRWDIYPGATDADA